MPAPPEESSTAPSAESPVRSPSSSSSPAPPSSRPPLSLTDLRRVGPALAGKLIGHFGSEAAALAALDSGDLTSLAEVEGVGANLALRLARDHRRMTTGSPAGNDGDSGYLATSEARRLWERIIQLISGFAPNGHVRDQLRLLEPLPASRRTAIKARRLRFGQALELHQLLTFEQRERLMALLGELAPIREPPATPTRGRRVIVTTSDRAHERLQAVSDHCRLYRLGEEESHRDYLGFDRLTWVGSGSPDRLPPGWERMDEGTPLEELVPEAITAWFHHNRKALSALADLGELAVDLPAHPLVGELRGLAPKLGGLSELMGLCAPGGLDGANDVLEALALARKELSGRLGDVQLWVNQEIDRKVGQASLTLEGRQMLAALQDRQGRRLQGLVASEVEPLLEEITRAGESRIISLIGPLGLNVPNTLFAPTVPRELEPRAIQEIERDLEAIYHRTLLTELRQAARDLGPLREGCRDGLRLARRLALELTIARWADRFGLTMPRLEFDGSTGLALEGGRHLFLYHQELDGGPAVEAVDYGLGSVARENDRQAVALLSGANSGGKTTLLELVAQTLALAQAGLPVPARKARVGSCARLHLLAKVTSTQSAGALERTLKQLAAVVSDPASKVLLADELEAITEPGAGARIMAGLLEAASASPNNLLLMVSHLAEQIREATDIDLRIDGIAAVGLDEDYNLIVERTPRRDYLARSTPELIIRRLLEQTTGERRKVLEQVMAKFEDTGDECSIDRSSRA